MIQMQIWGYRPNKGLVTFLYKESGGSFKPKHNIINLVYFHWAGFSEESKEIKNWLSKWEVIK